MAKTGKVDKSRGVIGFGIFDQGSSGQGRLLSAERFCRNVSPHIWNDSEGVDLGPGDPWTACATMRNREERYEGSGRIRYSWKPHGIRGSPGGSPAMLAGLGS